MSTPAEGQTQDGHDLDKLARWQEEMDGPEIFPVYAVFIVSGADRTASDVFRQYRSAFQAAGAGFQHVVIFGQHGESTTSRALAERFAIPPDETPVLVLAMGRSRQTVYSYSLPTGDAEDVAGGEKSWERALERIVRSAGDGAALNLAGTGGQEIETLRGVSMGTLAQSIARALEEGDGA